MGAILRARALVVASFLSLASAGFFSAQAQVCGVHAAIVEALVTEFGEWEIAEGVGTNGLRYVVLASKDRSTWTLLAVTGGEVACVIAEGDSWERIDTSFENEEAKK